MNAESQWYAETQRNNEPWARRTDVTSTLWFELTALEEDAILKTRTRLQEIRSDTIGRRTGSELYWAHMKDPGARAVAAGATTLGRMLSERFGVPYGSSTVGWAVIAMSERGIPLCEDTEDALQLGSEMFAQEQYAAAGSPLWKFAPRAFSALVETDPPVDEVDQEFLTKNMRLPFPALELVLPPNTVLDGIPTHSILIVDDSATQVSTLDQLGVAMNTPVASVAEGVLRILQNRMEPIIRLITIPPTVAGTIRVKTLGASAAARKAGGSDEATSLVINFLLGLHAGYLDTRRVQPQVSSPKKIKKLESRGEIMRMHTVVDLGRRADAAQRAAPTERDSEELARRTVSAHVVRGHWHAYWVRVPGDRPVLATKPGPKGVVLNLVARWLFPYVKGELAPFRNSRSTKPTRWPQTTGERRGGGLGSTHPETLQDNP